MSASGLCVTSIAGPNGFAQLLANGLGNACGNVKAYLGLGLAAALAT